MRQRTMAGQERAAVRRELIVPAGARRLAGDLHVPGTARGLVVFAHGSGSSRHSPRNRRVARVLENAGLVTFLLDLLEETEAGDRRLVFDVDLLARRLLAATDHLAGLPETGALPVGYFGASTGAAAALIAAARRGPGVHAVVSRGGRPDLARAHLDRVEAPTLLIVGGRDVDVLRLNREALAALCGEKQLVVVPGATHLFEEPGALEQVASLALDWFRRHLPAEGTT